MTSRARWSCLLVCAVLIAARAPVLLIEPRLWIEEATVYLSYGFSQNALRTLLFIPTAHGPAGYILLPAQVINSQLFFGLVAFLLLFEELRGAGRRRLWIYRLALVFCGLSGAYTAFLALPYYLRARLDRSREAWIHFSIVAGSALVHLVLYAATLLTSPITPERLGGPHLGAYPVAR